MQNKNRRLIYFIAGSFLSGVSLLLFVRIWQPAGTLAGLSTLHDLLGEIGFAFVVASVVALIFEMFLSGERDRHLKGLMRQYQEMEDFGFRRIFVDRQNVFDKLVQRSLREANHVRIIGICISIFREFNRQHKRRTEESPVDFFVSQVLQGQRLEVLMLRRTPEPQELKTYGMESGDFYHMREWDEDKPEAFDRGRRLRKIANQAVGQWIEVLTTLADRSADRPQEVRREILHRIQLKEYIALPSLSLYILDEEIYVTPYLYKRHCSSVPAFVVGGNATPLYSAYLAHFTETWNSKLTTPSVPYELVELLVVAPRETIARYRSWLERIRDEDETTCLTDHDYVTSPEYFRAEERAMARVLAEEPTPSVDQANIGSVERALPDHP